VNNDPHRHPLRYQDDTDEDYGHYRSRSPWFKWVAVLVVLAFLALALPNLVHLLNAGQGLQQDPTLNSDPLAQAAKPGIVLVQARTENGLALQGKRGTGFNIRDDGAIVTNEHVVSDALSVSVLFLDGRIYYTNRWQKVGDADLVVLDIRAEGLPVLPLKDYMPQIGQTVTVIGNPLDMERLVQKGTISTVAPSSGKEHCGCFEILITAAPGLSGSPVIDDTGAVIGVVYAARQAIDSQSSTALAIPLSTVRTDLHSALKRLK
jgi:serine protease Do